MGAEENSSKEIKTKLSLMISAWKSKKSGYQPQKEETEDFNKLWCSYVDHNGYDAAAEEYLFDGFRFIGADCFVEEMCKAKDPHEFLMRLYQGDIYKKNTNQSTHEVLFCVLAGMINHGVDPAYEADVIKRIPRAATTVDKKLNQKAPGNAARDLLNRIKPGATFDYAAVMEQVDKTSEEVFRNILQTAVDSQHGKFFIKYQGAIRRGISMFHLNPPAETSQDAVTASVPAKTMNKPVVIENAVETKVEPQAMPKQVDNTAQTVPAEQKKKIEEESSSVEERPVVEQMGSEQKKSDSAEEKGEPQTEYKDIVLHSLMELSKTVNKLASDQEALKKAMDQIRSKDETIARLQNELSSEKSVEEDLRKENEVLKNSNLESVQRAKELEQSLKEEQEKCASMEEQLRGAQEISKSAVQSERKKAEENLNRIGSKLKIEYEDFSEIMDEPMTEELGDNLRYQLQGVFDILKNSGIRLE